MKIAYLCNVIVPSIAKIINERESVFGGWLAQTIEHFAADNEILYFAPFKNNIKVQQGNITFVGFDFVNQSLAGVFERELLEFIPNIIHIWGSEFEHSYYMSEAVGRCGMRECTVLSLQGIISEYARVFTTGIPEKVINRWLLGDIVRGYNIKQEQRRFVARGKCEKNTLLNIKHAIGRTAWDKKSVLAINPNIKYHYCGESLREEFYQGESWNYDDCDKYSIFICQSHYPIKGFHFALQIIKALKDKYPNISVITTGKTYVASGVYAKLKQSSYQNYIRKMIERLGLVNNIKFIGSANAGQIKEQLLRCNVLLSPSVIENSPNSIGEAMMLGTPIVASDVGGVSSIISEKEGHLYALDEPQSAISEIDKLFRGIDIKSELAKRRAKIQYNVENVVATLNAIYAEISR